MTAISNSIKSAHSNLNAPSIIICHTHIGWGSPRQDSSKAHGEPLGIEDLQCTKKAFGWPLEPDSGFQVLCVSISVF